MFLSLPMTSFLNASHFSITDSHTLYSMWFMYMSLHSHSVLLKCITFTFESFLFCFVFFWYFVDTLSSWTSSSIWCDFSLWCQRHRTQGSRESLHEQMKYCYFLFYTYKWMAIVLTNHTWINVDCHTITIRICARPLIWTSF